MTNSWVDLDHSTLYVVQGANPAENHPASIAHMNVGRFDGNNRGRNAGLIVIDPRQTRTARMTGVPYNASNPHDQRKHDRYVRIRPGTNIAFTNGVTKAIIDWMYANRATSQIAQNFFDWHNTASGKNAGSFARTFIDDTGTTRTFGVAQLSGAEYFIGGAWVSAPLSTGWPKYCDSRVKVNSAGDDYQRATLRVPDGSGGYWEFSNMLVFAANIDDPDCVFQKLRTHLAPYTKATVADICGCTEADIEAVAQAYIENSRFASSDFGAATATPTAAGYRTTVMMYAMGATQFTSGSQGVRTYAILQTMMGNMGRIGGGIDALRGIHNVQGSTDMGVLFDLIPGYSGNPGVGQTYADYSNKLFGNRVIGTGAKNPYNPAELGLQQRGFYNMTVEWFGERRSVNNRYSDSDFEKLYACWPKGNGYNHTEAFRRMITGDIKAAVIWGQNPAVTEPHQSAVRDGLENLDLLVVADMFATETAQCKRKNGSVTYLLPAASHVEEAGSVVNSGRWIQWRDRARAPKGNSKSDLELLLRLAKALHAAGAFSHIEAQWDTMTSPPSGNAWQVLYQKYGWDGVSDFESLAAQDAENEWMYGSEVVAENIFKEMASPLDGNAGDSTANAGTIWIYSGTGNISAYNADTSNVQPVVDSSWGSWGKRNRAKSRKGDPEYAHTSMQYPRYGWAWLLNRRVFYNNGEVPGDVPDVFVAAGVMARLFVLNTNTLADWSLLYRTYSTLADRPDRGLGDPHYLPGRFPAYTEPYESPRPDLVSRWGLNTANGASLLVNVPGSGATPIGTVSDYPLVLTTIRCVEHFQGGPITRNNPWNVEAEPEPWIEINSVDALKYGIKDGDWVNVITARSNSTTDEEGRTTVSGWAKGFKARVGVGTLANQRVAPGVVAIPWHWGDRGLGIGSRANDLCHDAFDANTRIPEYKALLCKIEKA